MGKKQDTLTKAFEPDFALEIRTLSSGNSPFLEDRILGLLKDINYDYVANTTEGVLLVKRPKTAAQTLTSGKPA